MDILHMSNFCRRSRTRTMHELGHTYPSTIKTTLNALNVLDIKNWLHGLSLLLGGLVGNINNIKHGRAGRISSLLLGTRCS